MTHTLITHDPSLAAALAKLDADIAGALAKAPRLANRVTLVSQPLGGAPAERFEATVLRRVRFCGVPAWLVLVDGETRPRRFSRATDWGLGRSAGLRIERVSR